MNLRIPYIFLAILCYASALASTVNFIGNRHPVIQEKAAASTGLNSIYVLHDTEGVSISYTASNGDSRPQWLVYDNRGGGFAVPVDNIVYSGPVSTLNNAAGDCGYIIEDGSTRTYFWVTDYSKHRFTLNSLLLSDESNCSSVKLDFSGNAEPIYYTTINGQQKELSRDIELSYSTLRFDTDAKNYILDDVTTQLDHILSDIYIDSPLTNTNFILSGDRFLKAWNEELQFETPIYHANSVSAYTEAEQLSRDNDNEQSSGSTGSLGGSAPVEIDFTAWVTDAVVFKEWQIARDSEFDLIEFRENNLSFSHIFRDAGNTYVRFAAANADGTCTYYSTTYDISIGESDIKCPNAFSPGTEDGVNDIWKVSYKSIISFECHIFNRWGQKMCSFNNPADGWDGKYKGKVVPSGVYYYVIKAKGADGRSYNLKGDINIINYERSGSPGTPGS